MLMDVVERLLSSMSIWIKTTHRWRGPSHRDEICADQKGRYTLTTGRLVPPGDVVIIEGVRFGLLLQFVDVLQDRVA